MKIATICGNVIVAMDGVFLFCFFSKIVLQKSLAWKGNSLKGMVRWSKIGALSQGNKTLLIKRLSLSLRVVEYFKTNYAFVLQTCSPTWALYFSSVSLVMACSSRRLASDRLTKDELSWRNRPIFVFLVMYTDFWGQCELGFCISLRFSECVLLQPHETGLLSIFMSFGVTTV